MSISVEGKTFKGPAKKGGKNHGYSQRNGRQLPDPGRKDQKGNAGAHGTRDN